VVAPSPNLNIMIKAARKAGRRLVRDFGEVEQLQVSRKGPGDFVSEADHKAEAILRAELAKAMNDMLMEYGAIIPLIHRGGVSAHAITLGGVKMNEWDSELWNVKDWHRLPPS